MAKLLTQETFKINVLESKKLVIIDLYADWCGPCKQMGPIFDELAQEYSESYDFFKVNIDEDQDIAIEYNVSSIPTFLFFKEGKLVAKHSGSLSKDSLLEKIKEQA